MIEAKGLTKLYGDKRALDDISFTVQDGEILGFLGPNGAGKSTTMNIITGYTSSTEGTVRVNGAEILEDPIGVKSQIGYLPEHPPLYPDMTVQEYLEFMYALKKGKGGKVARKKHIDGIAALVKISDVQHRVIKNLSKGYQQRVGLAQALLGEPSVLILDEPTVGLDPKQIIEIRNLIKGLGKKYTIILSSHILPEIQATCDRVIVIHQGRLIADDTPANLSRTLGDDSRLTLRVEGPQDKVAQLLGALPQVQRVEPLGQREEGAWDFMVQTAPGADVRRELFSRLSQKSWPLLSLNTNDLSLEDIFLRLTENAAAPKDKPPPKRSLKSRAKKEEAKGGDDA